MNALQQAIERLIRQQNEQHDHEEFQLVTIDPLVIRYMALPLNANLVKAVMRIPRDGWPIIEGPAPGTRPHDEAEELALVLQVVYQAAVQEPETQDQLLGKWVAILGTFMDEEAKSEFKRDVERLNA